MNVVTGKAVKLLLNMPHDTEIVGRIYYQAVEILGQNFLLIQDENIKNTFSIKLLDVMIKLEAMKYHRNNFEHYENEYLQFVEENSNTTDNHLNKTHILLFELESFLFQIKSSLDLAVKILSVLIPGKFKVHTFESKGDKLRSGLDQYLKDKNCKIDYAKGLIDILNSDKEAWLKSAINLRDDVAHYKTYSEFNYKYEKINGKESFNYPKISGMEPLKYINLLYQNCIEFIQDFMCLSIGLYLPKNMDVGVNNEGSYNVGKPFCNYIKFGIGIRPTE